MPHFLLEGTFRNIAPYADKSAFIGVLPGGGGCEFFFEKYFARTNTLFGFQRVPFTAKLVTYGQETNLKSWKPFSVAGTLQRDRITQACEMAEACGLKTKAASNYLEIALTPTNPLLHTSRTYEIFGKYDRFHVFTERAKFYVGWSDEASRTLFSMDAELHSLLDSITCLDTSAIRPLSEHYESQTAEELTKKINSIPTFQTVYATLISVENGYCADTSSRLFAEDFPWGLLVIRSYFDLFNIEAPVMDTLLKWYSDYMGLEWYAGNELCGRDLDDTGIIQKYGVRSREELLKLYTK